MYKDLPAFAQPDREDIKVWRYMDFTKLVSLINSGCLFFTRGDKFDDPFEGSWPKKNVLARQKISDKDRKEMTEKIPKTRLSFEEWNKSSLMYYAANCWHMNEHESEAMWKLYAKNDAGIAVQSTYKKFEEAIAHEKNMRIDIVKYIDYETDSIDSAGTALSAPFHKRKSFEHEREVRAVVWWTSLDDWRDRIGWKPMDGPMPIPSLSDVDDSNEPIDAGLYIKVDVKCLIEHIYVAPNSPTWFADLVKAVLKKYKYGNIPVKHSKLDEPPVY